jgi:hypothetical protein
MGLADVQSQLRGRGEVSLDKIAEEYEAFLYAEQEAGRLDDLIPDLARKTATADVHRGGWDVKDGQIGMFDGDAWLALGDGLYIAMAEARGSHAARHQAVLNENYRRVTAAFLAKNAYLTERMPQLYQRGCTLGDLEAAPGSQDLEAAA